MSLRVLVVDDDPGFQVYIEELLRQFFPRIDVRTLSRGRDTLQTTKHFRPDIILLDVVLPDTSGFEICRRLKADPDVSSIPVILISGVMTDASDRTLGLQSGAEGYLCKPFEPMELVAQMRALLRLLEDLKRHQQREMEIQEQRIEALGLLAGGLAHEFNNLLTAMVGNISLARSLTSNSTERELALKEAEQAAMRARSLTNQLLTFARGGEPIRTAFALEPLLRSTVERLFSGSAVEVRYAIAEALPLAFAEASQIGRAIENVLLNAKEAMTENGLLIVRAEPFLQGDAPPPRDTHLRKGLYIRVSITDNGVGIDEKDLRKIFDLFYSSKGLGRGLGLPIARSILHRHDGAITLTSSPKEGTTVTLYIPAIAENRVHPDAALQSKSTSPPTSRARILVMDDEASIRKLLVRALTMSGYEVDGAPDGQTAIERLRTALADGRPYDLAILDLTVPNGMGGAEAVRQMRKLHPKLVAIASSGYSNDPVMARYRDYEFDGVVTKPYALPELMTLVQKTLASIPP